MRYSTHYTRMIPKLEFYDLVGDEDDTYTQVEYLRQSMNREIYKRLTEARKIPWNKEGE